MKKISQTEQAADSKLNENKSTVHYFSYRYSHNGSPKISKTSLDLDIYSHFLALHNNSTRDSQAELLKMAKLIRETQTSKYAGYLREAILCKIIKPELIENYELNPNYVKVMCAKDQDSNTAVNIPSTLYHALSVFFHCDKPDPFINLKYIEVRNSAKGDTNFSYELRKALLSSVLR